MSGHYYRTPTRRSAERRVISDVIRGVPVELIVEPGIFSARRVDKGTRILIESMLIPDEGKVLDMGTGYGVIGIVIAKLNPRLKVYMVDVNALAVKLAKLNARINGVADRVVILHGNLYEPVKDLVFDSIITNPPYSAGMDVVKEIIAGGYTHLKPGGTLQLVVRKGWRSVMSFMESVFGNVRILTKESGYRVLLSERKG